MLRKRILIASLLGLLFGIVVSEISFLWLRQYDRSPQRIELTIPAGTASRIAQGESPPGIPADMGFVLGDTLVVINQDIVAHQLGPLWIPSASTASLRLDQEGNLAFQCSFELTHYFGLDVRASLDTSTRIVGILEAAIPMFFLILLYGLLVCPLKKQTN
ncbi:MAG: hypothetical protein M1282_07840 [Chloroflexi bacterium]|nr:hypothetical protein [Chloroflexota bacterium]